jgi:hypothetical protein
MTLCPGALTIGCKKCPIFKICPAKGLIGDYKPQQSKSADSSDQESKK